MDITRAYLYKGGKKREAEEEAESILKCHQVNWQGVKMKVKNFILYI